LDLLKAAPQLCSTDIEIIKRSKYETTFGIYNHDTKMEDRPWALVAMQDSEDTCENSLLYEKTRQFALFKTGKHFNISIKEFFEFPTDYCDYLLEVSEKLTKEESEIASDILDDLEKK
jgi:hypothetical protein